MNITKLIQLVNQVSDINVSMETLRSDKGSHTQEIYCWLWDAVEEDYKNNAEQFGTDLKELVTDEQWKKIKGPLSKVKRVYTFAKANELLCRVVSKKPDVADVTMMVDEFYSPYDTAIAMGTVYKQVGDELKRREEQAKISADSEAKMYELYKEKHPETAKLSDSELRMSQGNALIEEGQELLAEYNAAQALDDADAERKQYVDSIVDKMSNDPALYDMLVEALNK